MTDKLPELDTRTFFQRLQSFNQQKHTPKEIIEHGNTKVVSCIAIAERLKHIYSIHRGAFGNKQYTDAEFVSIELVGLIAELELTEEKKSL
jgi:hypothetical protein